MKLTFSEECLILRRRAGLLLSDAAKVMKVSINTLSLIELGDFKSRVSPEKAYKYRDFLISKQEDSPDGRS